MSGNPRARMRGFNWSGVLLALTVGPSAACSVACEPAPEPSIPEDVWLTRIGSGAAQTARVCDRGGADRVAKVLCDRSRPPIHALDDLYRALRLDDPRQRRVAAATHSMGLSARTVSSLNPRVLVFENTAKSDEPLAYEQIVALGFTRGEQLVELVGLDPLTYEYNFYLLRFQQSCNASRCRPEDLLTDKIESGWTSWTLYSDSDLEDTPLDCVSCHQPFGKGTHKQLLMRQVLDPWMHWSDFRGGTERSLCLKPPVEGGPGKVVIMADGLDRLLAMEGSTGRYAGVPLAELHQARSGDALAELLVNAEQTVRLSPYPDYPYAQLYFQTREVLCERFHTGASATWEQHRRESQMRGLPVPYHQPTVLDAARGTEMSANRQAFLRRNDARDAFSVALSLVDATAATAIGFAPRPDDSAPEILRGMCIRCHAAGTDQRLRRARFDVEALDHLDPEVSRTVRRRLTLPHNSPELMPPLRTGELPSWAVDRIADYLRDHCIRPGACD